MASCLIGPRGEHITILAKEKGNKLPLSSYIFMHRIVHLSTLIVDVFIL